MAATLVFQADFDGPGFRGTFPHFSSLLSDAGIPPRFFFRKRVGIAGSLLNARAVILDYADLFDQGEEGKVLEAATHQAIEAGARVLCIAGAGNDQVRGTLNRFLERYGLALLGERHFRPERYEAHGAFGRLPRDQLPVVPADIIAATDGLARGVQELIFEQPAGVLSTSPQSRPLLWALSNPGRVDYADVLRDPIDGDEVVAQAWTPIGEHEPRLIVFGDGSWLVDDLIGRADNERLALNIVRWLAGEATGASAAAEAQSLIDRIELTLWDVVSRRLSLALGPVWTERVAEVLDLENRLEAEASDAAHAELVRSGLYLSEKTKVLRDLRELDEVYRMGELSRSNAKRRWGKFIGLRNRVAHADNRCKRPVAPEELSELRLLEAALSAIWQSDLARAVVDAAPSSTEP